MAIFDADNALVRWNRAYEALYAPIAGRIVAGATFVELLHATAEADMFEEQPKIDQLDARLGSSRWSEERTLKDGAKVRILYYRLVDGSLVAFQYRTLYSAGSISEDKVEDL